MKWTWIAASTLAVALASWAGYSVGSNTREGGAHGHPRIDDRVCVAVGLDQVVLVVTDEGVAAFDFLVFAAQDQLTKYRWRYRAHDGTPEQAGMGDVYEKYNPTSMDAEERSYDSAVTLTAGHINLKWSYGSPRRGWIYYRPDQVRHVAFHDDSRFDALRLDDGLFDFR